MSFPGKRSDGVMRTGARCVLNATSAICFGSLLLLILGPALLGPKSAKLLGGGSAGLSALSRGLQVPLTEAAVLLAIIGGTLSTNRRQRNLAAAVAGLIVALAILRHLNII